MNTARPLTAIDTHIGRRIRERRKILKLSQADMAELMGFSYQQMQKYETGASQISAGKLLLFAKILNVPISYFYEGMALEEPRQADNAAPADKPRARSLRLLLANDNFEDIASFRKSIGVYAQQVDIKVARDPASVMDLLLNHKDALTQKMPDIVMVDFCLRRSGGMDLLKSIKAHPRTRELPVVILANGANSEDMMEAYRNGAAGVIRKSPVSGEYVKAMEAVMRYWAEIVALPWE